MEDVRQENKNEIARYEDRLKEAKEDCNFQVSMRKRFEHFVKDNIVKHVNDSLVRSQSLDLDERAATGTFSDKMRETFGFSAELANIDKVTEYAIDL